MNDRSHNRIAMLCVGLLIVALMLAWCGWGGPRHNLVTPTEAREAMQPYCQARGLVAYAWYETDTDGTRNVYERCLVPGQSDIDLGG